MRTMCRSRDARGRRLLDDFLVTALHRAIAFTKIDGIPETVGKHLNLDVARVLEVLLQVYTLGLPKKLCASARVMFTALISAASVWTTRMPRPPPPPAALMITG
jgi:hypothetical protein